jgi:diketogulonate reductase-like aldo/keto reductase
MDYITLNNGISVPQIGFGTWRLEGSQAYNAVDQALKVGYRHIDTAFLYANEKEVGQAVKNSSISREKIFITTKVWNGDHSYKKAYNSFARSLKLLDVDYVDMLLIHWPVPVEGWQKQNQDMWKAFEEIYNDGKAKAIGISNFHKIHIDSLMEKAVILPAVNQIKVSPGVLQTEVVKDTKAFGIAVEAYSPLDKGIIADNQILQKIAVQISQNGKKKSPAQITLRWHMQKGYIAIPKASSVQHAKSNLDIFDFELSEIQMREIEKIKSPDSKVPDPNTMLE